MKQFPIDSRTLHEDLGVKSKHADWVHRFIKRLELVEGEDFITYRKDKKHIYKFTECVLAKMEVKPSLVESLPESVTKPANMDGFVLIDGDWYMASTELAARTEKLHSNVMRDINEELRKMQDVLGMASETNAFLVEAATDVLNGVRKATYVAGNGKVAEQYLLNRVAALFVASRYSSAIRAVTVKAFMDRMLNLEVYTEALENSKNNLAYRHVYVILDDDRGYSKIGVAKDPTKRLATLQTGNASDLWLAYQTPVTDKCFDIEAKAHEHFSKHLIKGEWFDEKLAPEVIVQWIEHTIKGESQ